MKSRKINQGGYVRMYWVVAILLVLVLAGTIYFVRGRAEQARKEQLIAAVDEKAKAETEQNAKNEVKTNSSDSETVQSGASAGESSETKNTKSTELPKTGPGEIINLALISALFGLLVAYGKSRTALRQSL